MSKIVESTYFRYHNKIKRVDPPRHVPDGNICRGRGIDSDEEGQLDVIYFIINSLSPFVPSDRHTVLFFMPTAFSNLSYLTNT